MIDRDHGPSVSRQAKVLGISRGSVHYLPRPTSDADLALMRRIDELHLEYPFAGSRMLKGLLQAEGHEVGRLHVSTLMKRMAIEALYRRPNTSKPAPGHKVYPYLLRKLTVTDAEPRLGHGHHLHSDGPRRSASVSTDGDQSLTLSRRGGRLVQPQGPWHGGCRSRSRPTSASRRWRRRSGATAGRRSSTATRVRSSPASTSPRC